MAEVLNMPLDNLDQTRLSEEEPPNDKQSEDPISSSPPPSSQPPQQQPPSQQQQHPKRRDRDSGERRDDRDNDRPFNRRGGGGGGLYSDHNRSPPQMLPRDREYRDNRDRDYKRRNSLSPPLPYRERRRTPPPRRSPPFAPYNKRSRRDDGGYDGRRGSPRGGGFWHGERRFGYDHGNGYEREMGGRPQFGDERPHGRYGGRSGGYQNGPPDWEYGRGGYNDASSTGASQREGLMSYKQFIQELEDDILPAEAERRYQEYKSEYISTQKRVFFDAHKNEEWLKDKYHPTNLLTVIERRNELARKSAKDFLLDLQSASLDLGPSVNSTTTSKPSQTSDPNSDDDVDAGGKRRRHGRGPANEFDLASSAPKAHPICSEPRRIHIDVEQAQALVRKLDSEKGIGDNILGGTDSEKLGREKSHSSAGPVVIVCGINSVKGLEGLELLDTMITYLWRVHGLDYYGTKETCEPKGLRHVRAEGKISNAINGTEWEKFFDLRWNERLSGPDPLEIMTAKERIEAAAVEGLDPYTRKIRDEKYGWKYGCGAKGCTKLFHASEFVHKHLKLKHPEIVIELTSQLREDLYFQNYMNDSDAPGGTPVMQQSLPKDRLQRRRPGDARENMRNRDDRGIDRAENMQPHDFQPNNDGPEGGNFDQPMFESFGAPTFGSDIAPPSVLMPVPGAGPLGPFVPAPPEVAMRMLREQGGPPAFEAGTRNGRPGPQLGGSAPLIALPHAFRQDPRRLRSYQDLDAPEDEVTVIDYRSL